MRHPSIGEGIGCGTYEGAEHEVVVVCHGGMVEERSFVGIPGTLNNQVLRLATFIRPS